MTLDLPKERSCITAVLIEIYMYVYVHVHNMAHGDATCIHAVSGAGLPTSFELKS